MAAGSGATDWNVIPAGCFSNQFHQQTDDFSEPGLTSEQILARVPDATRLAPHIIFVSAGGNDAIQDHLQPGTYPVAKTMKTMADLFDQLVASKAVVVYLGLNPPMQGGERLPQISALARQKGVLVVDGMAGTWTNKTLMSDDDIHPNDKGYQIMCKRTLDALAPVYP